MNKSFPVVCSELIRNLKQIEGELALDRRTSAEDQLKVPIHNFLTTLGEIRSYPLSVFTEHRQGKDDQVDGVRLDMAVKNARGQLVGHIELKAPAKSANPYRQSGWTRHDKAQWRRLSNHSNLIYTNGWEWTLLRHGADRPVSHVVLDPGQDGSIPASQEEAFLDLLTLFLSWKPSTPSTPRGLAEVLAPLARFLKDTVYEVVTDRHPDALDVLYRNWTADLMPGATEEQFADSFAQTFTYALLLARVESNVPEEEFDTNAITPSLTKNGHRLIGAILQLMAQPQNRVLVDGPISLLEATVGAVDVKKFKQKADPWLYFYEDFLAAYDPKMRADAGVYYTPVQIVEAQVRLLDEVLKTRFGRAQGLGDESIQILDNAAGTATYPLAVAAHVLADAVSPRDAARSLAKRLHAFELLMGPYAVAHMRLTQLLESTGADLGDGGVQVYLTNSLTDPGEISGDNQQISMWEVMGDINEENRKAGLVKNSHTPIRVILGNPPYDRGSRKKALGAGSENHKNLVLEEVRGKEPLLNDFIEPLKMVGRGGQAKNLYNSYVYFIRWAIWKVCEQHPNQTGVVSYITSSSYLRGPGFAGLREYMRKVFDEIWIIDLGGEGRGARKEENVFAIQTPVAIFLGIQHPTTSNGTVKKHSDRVRQKAMVFYRRVIGTRAEKLGYLRTIQAPTPTHHPGWEKLSAKNWGDKLVPSSVAALSDGILVSDVFPWNVSGAQFKRKWPIAPNPDALFLRWERLFADHGANEELFSPDRDCTVESRKKHLFTQKDLPALANPAAKETLVAPVRYGYRSFDRQWCIPDHRVATYIRQSLWDSQSSSQLYLVTLTATTLGEGPAITLSPYVPDMDFFKNRGAKDVHPLFRDAAGVPNISAKVLNALKQNFGVEPSPLDVASYVVGQLGTGAYTKRFADELEESAAHVIFTSDYSLFRRVASFGRRIIFEQTWGERGAELNEFGQPSGRRYQGRASVGIPTPSQPYPDSWTYDEEAKQLHVGDGRFDNVSPRVAGYQVSGMNIVASWLGYRMRTPAGKSSSPLDQMQTKTWQHDQELLELLWQLEFMVDAEDEAESLLEAILSGEKISIEDLGIPTAAERKAPPKKSQHTIFDI